MKNLEIEFKVMMDKASFDSLFSFLGKEKEHFIQENVYFETKENTLKKHGCAFRIRHIINENKYLFTLKEDVEGGKLEYEYFVNGYDLNDLPLEVLKILKEKNIDVSTLVEYAKITTERYVFEIDKNEVCLDHSVYYGKEDFEVECEAKSMDCAKNTIDNLFKKCNLKYSFTGKSKLKRALEAKSIL